MHHGALSNTKQNGISAAKFIAKMKGFSSKLTPTGRKIDADELKEYILGGLDGEYIPLADYLRCPWIFPPLTG
jgi:hypothetical protein